MRILQINAVYEKYSTGRNTKELHEFLQNNRIESYVASPDLGGLVDNCYCIGNRIDRKIHALCSRISGKQGYFSIKATKGLLNYMDDISPDIVVLGNLHGNYINLNMLLEYIKRKNIITVLVLHDCWFYTGKCVYYIEDNCSKWKNGCGECPALKKGNPSFFFDKSNKMLKDKEKHFEGIKNLAVVGVSKWVTDDVKLSILHGAKVITYIYNWIDLDLFSPDIVSNIRQIYCLGDKKIVLGVAMSWNIAKGIEIFNKLADTLPDEYQIVLIGDYSKVKNPNKKIKFVGTINKSSELAQFYSEAYVFVNPSIQETFGKTTAESMACGTPVIAYNGTAMPELIGKDGKCGALVNSLNALDYKHEIENMSLCDMSIIQQNCRNRATDLFDKDTNIRKYLELFDNLIDNRSKV